MAKLSKLVNGFFSTAIVAGLSLMTSFPAVAGGNEQQPTTSTVEATQTPNNTQDAVQNEEREALIDAINIGIVPDCNPEIGPDAVRTVASSIAFPGSANLVFYGTDEKLFKLAVKAAQKAIFNGYSVGAIYLTREMAQTKDGEQIERSGIGVHGLGLDVTKDDLVHNEEDIILNIEVLHRLRLEEKLAAKTSTGMDVTLAGL